MIEEDTFAEGQMFDGSSIAGWKAINESDMCLMPDPATACIDPFFAETTMSLICDILEPTTGEPYNRDPRGIAKKAEGMVKSMGIGDTIYFGPEAEFFVFDDVQVQGRSLQHRLQARLGRTAVQFRHRLRRRQSRPPRRHQEGLFPGAAAGFAQDMRSEMLAAMAQMGCVVEKHHHEVASAQHELGLKFAPLDRDGRPADHL